jgi:hypothetical protein
LFGGAYVLIDFDRQQLSDKKACLHVVQVGYPGSEMILVCNLSHRRLQKSWSGVNKILVCSFEELFT